MKEQNLKIGEIPAILFGEASGKLFLFVHGLGGNKEEARAFAEVACLADWQVLGIDLPQHGERAEKTDNNTSGSFDPWHVIPELHQVMKYAKAGWKQISLRANSIGSWFCLQAFSNEPLSQCLLVSPLVDMERMIKNMMEWSGVTEKHLEREKLIPTNFGQDLSWEYLSYVRLHPVNIWDIPTYILRAEKDEQVDGDTVETFSLRFGCKMTVMDGGEHWFHTPEQLSILKKWEAESLALCAI